MKMMRGALVRTSGRELKIQTHTHSNIDHVNHSDIVPQPRMNQGDESQCVEVQRMNTVG